MSGLGIKSDTKQKLEEAPEHYDFGSEMREGP